MQTQRCPYVSLFFSGFCFCFPMLFLFHWADQEVGQTSKVGLVIFRVLCVFLQSQQRKRIRKSLACTHWFSVLCIVSLLLKHRGSLWSLSLAAAVRGMISVGPCWWQGRPCSPRLTQTTHCSGSEVYSAASLNRSLTAPLSGHLPSAEKVLCVCLAWSPGCCLCPWSLVAILHCDIGTSCAFLRN